MLFPVEMNPYYCLVLRAQLEVEVASGFVDRIAVGIKLVRNVDGLSADHVTLLRTKVISGRKVKRCITGNAGRLIGRWRIGLGCRLASEVRIRIPAAVKDFELRLDTVASRETGNSGIIGRCV